MKTIKTSGTVSVIILFASSILCLRASTLSDAAMHADAVVAGSVTTRVEGVTATTFDITVHRVLKGIDVPATVHVSHQWNGGTQGPAATFDVTVKGIWLLGKTPSGNWDVIPCRSGNSFSSLFYPASAASPGGPYAYSPGASLVDSLAFEVAAGLEALGSPQDLLGVIDVAAASTPVVLGIFAASKDSSLQAVGLAGMLQTNQAGTLTVLSHLSPVLGNEPNWTLVVSALRDSWRDTTPTGIGQLSALVAAASTPSDLRTAGIRSLMATHTAESLPLFAELLFASNPDEQMEAAIAISAFVNGCNTQTPATVASLGHLNCGVSPYKSSETIAHQVFGLGSASDQAPAVAFWRTWWASHPGVH